MSDLTIVGMVSIIMSGFAVGIASIGPAFGQARALGEALKAIAQQPDAQGSISRTLFVGLAMIESFAIYAFVIAMILIFANPFWDYFANQAGG